MPEQLVRRPQLDFFLRQVLQMASARGMVMSPNYETRLGNPERHVELQLQQFQEQIMWVCHDIKSIKQARLAAGGTNYQQGNFPRGI